MQRPDEYFLEEARRKAQFYADCTRRAVGAVVVKDGEILSWGINHVPPETGRLPCTSGGCPRGLLTHMDLAAYGDYSSGIGKCYARHAEVDALRTLVQMRADYGTTLYVTDQPCEDCSVYIEKVSHVSRVIWPGATWIVRLEKEQEDG